MVFIYESTATTFTDNGLGSLWPSVCDVTEIINGRFDLSMTHPQDDEGKWKKLIKNRIVKAPYNGSYQLFRIYDVKTDAIAQIITVAARHIFYDLLWNLIEDTRPTVRDGNEAGGDILAGCQYASGFTFSSDIAALSTAYYIRQNPVQALIGDIDQSFINRWGGEIIRNNHAIAINSRIGADNGIRIAYKKNLTGLLVTESTDDTYTRIMPLATDADNSVLQLTGKYVDSALIASYPAPIITTVKFDDIKVDPAGTYTTQAAARAEMTTRVNAMYAAGVDLPTVTLDVQFVSWADLEEYKAFAALFTVALGDDVTVEYSPLNIDINLRVTEVVYDCLNARYKSLRIGDLMPSLGSHMTGVDSSIAKLGADVANKFDIGTKYNAVSITNEDGFACDSEDNGEILQLRMNGQVGFKAENTTSGSYTQMRAGGFYRYDGELEKEFFYRSESGELYGQGTHDFDEFGETGLDVELPEIWRGKYPTIIVIPTACHPPEGTSLTEFWAHRGNYYPDPVARVPYFNIQNLTASSGAEGTMDIAWFAFL